MFRVILLCLLTCCSSFMPLKHSESNISEDHTQVVESKVKRDTIYTTNGDNVKIYYLPLETVIFDESFTLRLIDKLAENGPQWYEDFFYHTMSGWNAFTPNRQYFVPFMDKTYNYGNTFYKYKYDYGTFNLAAQYPSTLNPNTLGISITTIPSNVYYHGYDISFINDGNPSYSDPGGSILSYRVWLRRYANADGSTMGGFSIGVPSYSCIFVSGNDLSVLKDFYVTAREGDILYEVVDSLQNAEYEVGYNDGYSTGLIAGESNANSDYYNDGYSDGVTAGYTDGYNNGVSDTIASGSEAMTIFAGIMDVAFIPVNVFFLMFNYEVFGINIAGFVSGLLTIAIVIILMRFIFGRKV